MTSKPSLTNCPKLAAAPPWRACPKLYCQKKRCKVSDSKPTATELKEKFNMSVILVVIALVFHLFPFRTEKLSPTAPMVLRKRESRSPPPFFKPSCIPFSGPVPGEGFAFCPYFNFLPSYILLFRLLLRKIIYFCHFICNECDVLY